MGRNEKIIILVLILISIFISSAFAEQTDDFKKLYQFYKKNYNFYAIPDTVYPIETELKIPEGYSLPPWKDITVYSEWVSRFPLWHRYKGVGNWKRMEQMKPDQIARAVHLPWEGTSFKDFAIPIRILGEYYFQYDRRHELKISPPVGEIMTYDKWLNGKPAYTYKGDLIFKDDVKKEDTEKEYYKFLQFCMNNSDYKSLAADCNQVEDTKIKPGDLFIAYDDSGKQGLTYVILCLISNGEGNTLYLVATGCPEACDFHIPLIKPDRDAPWVTIDEIRAQNTSYKNSGFFRFKSIK